MHLRPFFGAMALPFCFGLHGCGGAVSDASEEDNSSTPPASPDQVSVSAASQRAVIRWAPVTGADRYTLYMANDFPVTAENYQGLTGQMRHQDINDTEYVHPGLTNDLTYYFIVSASNAAGEGAASTTVAATPRALTDHAPQDLTATAGDGQVTLDWRPPGPGFIYNIYWGLSDGASQAAGTKLNDVGDPPFVHTGLTNGETYYYVVTALDGNTPESGDSAQVAAVPQGPPAPPPPPEHFNVQADDGRLLIQWGRVPGADSYALYMASQPGVTPDNYASLPDGMHHGGITELSYRHPSLENGKTYYFILLASNGAGSSPPSAEFQGTPGPVAVP